MCKQVYLVSIVSDWFLVSRDKTTTIIDILLYSSLFGAFALFKSKRNRDQKSQHLDKILEKYEKYRMTMVLSILKTFKIAKNDKDKLGWLIEEAEKRQKENFILNLLTKYYTILGGLLLAVAKSHIDEIVRCNPEAVGYAIVVFSIVGIALHIMWKSLIDAGIILLNMFVFKTDYYIYGVLIYDLSRLRLFDNNILRDHQSRKKEI